MTAAKKLKTECPEHAARHCIADMPYRMIVFARENAGVPLYQVAGSPAGAMGARKALKTAYTVHGGICFYCEKAVQPGALAIDHVEASAIGGSGHIQNLVLSCKPCNAAKGATPIELYKPKAGRAWLSAVLAQVQDRLDRL
jgi:5-methylcytosine-specific restriction endonuclease McrA